MSCIDEDLIQQYIDEEVQAEESERITRHLAVCPGCAKLVAERRQWALSMKRMIREVADEPVVVPPFVAPAKSVPLGSLRKRLVLALSAACLLAFFVLHWNHPSAEKSAIEDELTILQHSDWPVDANQPFSQQGLQINLIDPEGNVTGYVLE
ncbi:zf-HC2 domain-containing protein [uncultured Sunxiuqinia sp.]|uniref:anti-sigma factor family protein n=1 Tax=uncultured Sunxiuqinia sp. TaxID=1573825 RepID=UPI00261DEC6A|nr:zf-HC2 domain-containing protein [uncultured Sunxiuqinia sp.]